jgi:hypothetical protein
MALIYFLTHCHSSRIMTFKTSKEIKTSNYLELIQLTKVEFTCKFWLETNLQIICNTCHGILTFKIFVLNHHVQTHDVCSDTMLNHQLPQKLKIIGRSVFNYLINSLTLCAFVCV